MQTDALGPLLWFKVTANGIGNHRIQFRERISLRGDAAAARRVPARDIAAGFRTRLDLENDFSNRAHAGKLNAMRFGVNAAKMHFVQRRGRGIFVETKIKMFSSVRSGIFRQFYEI